MKNPNLLNMTKKVTNMAKYERQLRVRANDLTMFISTKMEESGAQLIDSSNYHMAGASAFFSVFCTNSTVISVAVLGTGETSTVTAIAARSAIDMAAGKDPLSVIEKLVDTYAERKH